MITVTRPTIQTTTEIPARFWEHSDAMGLGSRHSNGRVTVDFRYNRALREYLLCIYTGKGACYMTHDGVSSDMYEVIDQILRTF